MSKRSDPMYEPHLPNLARAGKDPITKQMRNVLVEMAKGVELKGLTAPQLGPWAVHMNVIRALNNRGLIEGTHRDLGPGKPVEYRWKLTIAGKVEAANWLR